MDLVAGAQNIIVVMTHASKNGESKLLPRCTLPLTGAGCIRRVLTDLALLEIEDGAFILREYAPSVSIDEIAAKTAGKMIVADDVREMRTHDERSHDCRGNANPHWQFSRLAIVPFSG